MTIGELVELDPFDPHDIDAGIESNLLYFPLDSFLEDGFVVVGKRQGESMVRGIVTLDGDLTVMDWPFSVEKVGISRVIPVDDDAYAILHYEPRRHSNNDITIALEIPSGRVVELGEKLGEFATIGRQIRFVSGNQIISVEKGVDVGRPNESLSGASDVSIVKICALPESTLVLGVYGSKKWDYLASIEDGKTVPLAGNVPNPWAIPVALRDKPRFEGEFDSPSHVASDGSVVYLNCKGNLAELTEDGFRLLGLPKVNDMIGDGRHVYAVSKDGHLLTIKDREIIASNEVGRATLLHQMTRIVYTESTPTRRFQKPE